MRVGCLPEPKHILVGGLRSLLSPALTYALRQALYSAAMPGVRNSHLSIGFDLTTGISISEIRDVAANRPYLVANSLFFEFAVNNQASVSERYRFDGQNSVGGFRWIVIIVAGAFDR